MIFYHLQSYRHPLKFRGLCQRVSMSCRRPNESREEMRSLVAVREESERLREESCYPKNPVCYILSKYRKHLISNRVYIKIRRFGDERYGSNSSLITPCPQNNTDNMAGYIYRALQMEFDHDNCSTVRGCEFHP